MHSSRPKTWSCVPSPPLPPVQGPDLCARAGQGPGGGAAGLPSADAPGQGEAGAEPRPGRRGHPGHTHRSWAQSLKPRHRRSGFLPLPQPGRMDRASVATGALKMHFCIPVSQQRPDALGGRYTVRAEPGRRAGEAGTRRGRLLAGLIRPHVSVCSCTPCTWTGSSSAGCATVSCIVGTSR